MRSRGSCSPPGAKPLLARVPLGGVPSQRSMRGQGTMETGRFSRCPRRSSWRYCFRLTGSDSKGEEALMEDESHWKQSMGHQT
eukprot:9249240-Heterocapsa_arctica.AAC.1